MAATYVQILKKLTQQTTEGSKTWQSTIDGNGGKIENESHVIIPNVNTNDSPPTLFAWVQLENKFLVPDSFFGKIISAGQEVQTLTQVGGSNTLTIAQTIPLQMREAVVEMVQANLARATQPKIMKIHTE